MSMKLLSDPLSDASASYFSAQSLLRIAVPAWRVIGIDARSEPSERQSGLSREELQSLFEGELDGKARRKSGLTAREEYEKRVALRLRKALYPSQERVFSH